MQQNGVNGCLFTAPNGNSLFLPAAGLRWDSELSSVGYGGHYWTSSLGSGNPVYAWGFDFDSSNANVGDGIGRINGFSVRPVHEN